MYNQFIVKKIDHLPNIVVMKFETSIGKYLGVGRDRAKNANDLARVTPYNERKIRSLIHYYCSMGIPIISATDSPSGYFIAENQEEINRFKKQIHSRISKLNERIKNI